MTSAFFIVICKFFDPLRKFKMNIMSKDQSNCYLFVRFPVGCTIWMFFRLMSETFYRVYDVLGEMYDVPSRLAKVIYYIGWHTRSWTILNCKKTHLASTQVNTIYTVMYIFSAKFYLPNFIDLPQLWNFQRPIEQHHPKFAYF